ncbi:MAG: PilT protein domain protein [Candidatus Beckwithbacteria bacterium GW2011_GWA2_43_10]|uniref:PilT protein domain protein n=1 Tax=Candidatus Beckwithbacteria bacterium GW2011_GWA2_43_10 TaxID=1618369 RepID=A0A0G1F0M8_9BACT|nr:MAG: PilT protein domain protein [Candidatus Beckwithbacteria bacterium GW2011_GWA2_43_10]
MNKLYLDTNVILDFVVRQQGKNFIKARKIFQQIEAGKIKVWLSILVIDETIWTIERFYKITRADYLQQLIDLFSLKGIKPLEIKKKDLFAIFKILWQKNVSFTDAYLYFLSQAEGKVISFDKDFIKLSAKIYQP